MGPLNLWFFLPIPSFCPLYFWKVLLMHSDGPIALADAAANYFTLAHYISGKHCQCTQMGPLHWQCCCQLLCLSPSDFWEALLMHLDGPIAFADASANYFALAHYFSRRLC